MKLLSHLLVFAIGIGLYAPAAVTDTPPWQPTGKYRPPDIKESSGIVASRQFEGVYWTRNDSGNPAALYTLCPIQFSRLSAYLYPFLAIQR